MLLVPLLGAGLELSEEILVKRHSPAERDVAMCPFYGTNQERQSENRRGSALYQRLLFSFYILELAIVLGRVRYSIMRFKVAARLTCGSVY